MRVLCLWFSSSIGRKFLVALAGLLLCGFLVAHLAGNLLLLVGEESFNHYAAKLEKNPALLPAEIALAGLFLLHITISLKLRWENALARPAAYAVEQGKGARTWGSRTMGYTAGLILLFLAVHIWTFKYGDKPGGLYKLVMSSFGRPAYSLFYVAAMLGLGLHLSHGFQSAFKTLGIEHPKYSPLIKAAGIAFALSVALGFAFLPAWAFMMGRR
ncbi:MAG: succinate dehydrogenase cytochrome b subunit [Elusimicrobia bacterium]|nr:succinate dehydrogenase cytochrome b subunit [Elusimicrobiota bacterium]